MTDTLPITEALVRQLIAEQFPQWAELSIRKVIPGGHDNRTFRLGDEMSVRLPSAERYAAKVEIEQHWLPKLAPHLSVPIPEPIVMGVPGCGYPFSWSVYRWLEGEDGTVAELPDMEVAAKELAGLLKSLHAAPTDGAPAPGAHNFFRGAHPRVYHDEIMRALETLGDRVDQQACPDCWQAAMDAPEWDRDPVWLHGDFAAGNLLFNDGKLSAVIDLGGMAVGDPACDLVIAWTFLDARGRSVFERELGLDEATWARARGWALWKELITLAEDVEGLDAAPRIHSGRLRSPKCQAQFERYEREAASLIGESVAKVRYWEIDYQTELPEWRIADGTVDSLDYGVELEFESGRTIGLMWDSEFACYGIGLKEGGLVGLIGSVGEEYGTKVWDATEYWKQYLGKAITKVDVYWSWGELVEAPLISRYYIPDTLELSFEDCEPVIISALELVHPEDSKHKERNCHYVIDNICVIFGREAAKPYQIGPFAPEGK